MIDTSAGRAAPIAWKRKGVLTAITLLFLIWAAAFVYHASFVAIDGQRYFSLFDDAMISMRYAWNLAHGSGLVWNEGQRVEGYTNLLMVMFMAIPNLLFEKRISALAVQLLGIILMVGNAYLAASIAAVLNEVRSQYEDNLSGLLVFAGTLAYYPLAFWSLMGMETGLLTFLILLAVLAAVRYSISPRTKYMLTTAVVLGLGFLARPDSLVASLVIIAFTATIPRGGRHNMRLAMLRALTMIGALSIFIVAQLVFRVAYYQEWLPNTYVLKLVGMPLSLRLENGLGFIKPLLYSAIPAALLLVAGAIARPDRWTIMFVTLAASLLGYQLWIGGEPWPYWRILAPSFPLILIVMVNGSSFLAKLLRQPSRASIAPRAVLALFGLYLMSWPFLTVNPRLSTGIGPADLVVIVFGAASLGLGVILHGTAFIRSRACVPVVTTVLTALALVSFNLDFLPEVIFRVRPYTVAENIEMVNRAIAISEVTTPEASVGVFYAGAIPYYTGLLAIDFLGRSDEYVARLSPDITGATGWYGMTSVPGHNKYDLWYSIARLTPTYIQGARWGRQNLTGWVERAYVTKEYSGVQLTLKRNDPSVLWRLLPPD